MWSYYLPFVSALFAKEKANNHLKLENIEKPLKIKKMQTRLYENKILVQLSLIFLVLDTYYKNNITQLRFFHFFDNENRKKQFQK